MRFFCTSKKKDVLEGGGAGGVRPSSASAAVIGFDASTGITDATGNGRPHSIAGASDGTVGTNRRHYVVVDSHHKLLDNNDAVHAFDDDREVENEGRGEGRHCATAMTAGPTSCPSEEGPPTAAEAEERFAKLNSRPQRVGATTAPPAAPTGGADNINGDAAIKIADALALSHSVNSTESLAGSPAYNYAAAMRKGGGAATNSQQQQQHFQQLFSDSSVGPGNILIASSAARAAPLLFAAATANENTESTEENGKTDAGLIPLSIVGSSPATAVSPCHGDVVDNYPLHLHGPSSSSYMTPTITTAAVVSCVTPNANAAAAATNNLVPVTQPLSVQKVVNGHRSMAVESVAGAPPTTAAAFPSFQPTNLLLEAPPPSSAASNTRKGSASAVSAASESLRSNHLSAARSISSASSSLDSEGRNGAANHRSSRGACIVNQTPTPLRTALQVVRSGVPGECDADDNDAMRMVDCLGEEVLSPNPTVHPIQQHIAVSDGDNRDAATKKEAGSGGEEELCVEDV